MQALILDDRYERQARLTAALRKTGIRTFATSIAQVAETAIRGALFDFMIAPERVNGKLTHSLFLLAEYRNPVVSSIMLTDRSDPDTEELFLLIPSLHCLLAPDSSPELIRKLAVASMAGVTDGRGAMVLRPSMRITGSETARPRFATRRAVAPVRAACPAVA